MLGQARQVLDHLHTELSMNQSRSQLAHRFQNDQAQIGVIGLGYVGLPLSLVFCHARYQVTGFDLDASKIATLNRGQSYIRHIGDDAIREARASGNFDASSDFSLLRQMDAIIICVPTPLNDKHEPDLSYIENTARTIAQYLRPGQLVVLESSTFPGTTEEVLLPILESSGVVCREECPITIAAAAAASSSAAGIGRGTTATAGADRPRAYVAYSPEREDPGNRQFTTSAIPKLVGGVDQVSGELAQLLYSRAFQQVIPVSSAKVAEMAKILENTYRCVNIALVNELKLLANRMGINIWEVIEAAASKPFGFQPFYPGPGLGGHCIPIDPFYLSWKAKEYDFTARFIHLAGEINTEMPYKVTETVMTALNGQGRATRGARILVLGIAYKKDIDDVRESPAIKIISQLRELGADVEYHDPHCPILEPSRQNSFSLRSVPFDIGKIGDYDGVLITTDHSGINYRLVVERARLVIDTRNATAGISAPHVVRC